MLYDQALLLIAYRVGRLLEKDVRTNRRDHEYVLGGMTSPEGASSPPRMPIARERGQVLYGQLRTPLPHRRRVRRSGERVRHIQRGQSEGGHSWTSWREERSASCWGRDGRLMPPWRRCARRELRPPPFMDDKIMADWNGLMIAALTRAYGHGDPRHGNAREGCEFVLNHMRIDGTLRLHRAGG